MKVYIEPGHMGDVLATVAIGDTYLTAWERNALPGWKKYCHRHRLGLIVFDQDMLSKDSKVWKKANWQKMLIGEALANSDLKINNVCYLDTDILINHFAPNVFDDYDTGNIGLVSQINGLPQPLHLTLRRLAFLRHTCYEKKYPLDSALFMTPKQIFEFHNVPPQSDYACTGLIMFNVRNHQSLMRSWFDKYECGIQSITGGGEEPHMNYEIQKWGKISWLPYEFQALWIYEAAWRYPFLFDFGRDNKELIRACIEASLYANHFLHFAGSWYECEMWKIGNFFESDLQRERLEAYNQYLDTPVTGMPMGLIKPA